MNVDPTTETPSPALAEIRVPCTDLEQALAFFTGQLGFRLDMIMPADAPRAAVVSGHGIALRLEAPAPGLAPAAPMAMSADVQAVVVSRAEAELFVTGRAGMEYRDLIPGRLGGRFIASHICIPDGGPVPDYVHYHHVLFQVIYCRRGWVRVVYEDQGPPFLMHAGDCVLQPPTIRHRVLESSLGLEVIEISCPAEHETWRDHALTLPSPQLHPDRSFGGQRFVRHIAADAFWQLAAEGEFEYRDTGIANATNDLASVRVLRALPDADQQHERPAAHFHQGELLFLFALDGRFRFTSQMLGTHSFGPGDACVIPAGADYALEISTGAEVLEVALPAK